MQSVRHTAKQKTIGHDETSLGLATNKLPVDLLDADRYALIVKKNQGQMTTKQQQETQAVFARRARNWHAVAQDRSGDTLNTLQQRYDYVVAVAERMAPVERFLDLGCGSGDLTVLMAERGADCVGIDFTPEMIEVAERHAETRGVLNKCSFVVGSVLECDLKSGKFDLAAALGLIEYFSFEQTCRLLELCQRTLTDGGGLIIASRNRLFNLVTFNEYTKREIETGNVEALMAEAMVMAAAESMAECLKGLAALDQIAGLLDTYPVTGVPVTVRHQYTPAQLCRLLSECGLTPVSVSPCHYHVAVPRFLEAHPTLHVQMSRRMQEHIVDCHVVVPQASSYMIYARKD